MRSKYSQKHLERLPTWPATRMLAARHNLPNRFVTPHESRTRFVFVCGCGQIGTALAAARPGNQSEVLQIGRETTALLPENGVLCGKRLVADWGYFAQAAGKSMVVEKTPKDVECVRNIHRVVPSPKLVPIVRNPLDNVASLYRRFDDLKACVGRWIVDNQAVARLAGSEGVQLVRFEDLTERPSEVFRRILEFLELPWEEDLLMPGDSNYGRFEQVENMTLRAAQVRREIAPRNGVWHEVLSTDEANWVKDKTATLAKSLGYP